VSEADVTAIASERSSALLAWGAAHHRDLPWRHTRDPWRVLVSEVMLQQTRVDRVVPRYLDWLDAYPTPAEQAAAPLSEVLRRWQGLGYPRRARNLRAAATLVVERHGGAVPDDLDALLALPGVGPYTARAVLAFAHERDVGVVDTNVGRVLARWAGRPLRSAEAQSTADALVPPGRAWDWNQSLFDLGALTCAKRTPLCGACPVGPWCSWRGGEGAAGERARAGAGAGAGAPDGAPDDAFADPADGSAAVSRPQSRFAGSQREARGRLLRALGDGPVAAALVAADAPGRIAAESLQVDGLIELREGEWVLRD
jgi:A/G-specific adenine glycosylase